MGVINDLTGQRFGKLTVISYAYTKRRAFWNCLCDCGNTCIVCGHNLVTGNTTSCGCNQLESGRKTGLSNRKPNKFEHIDENTVKVFFNTNNKYFICDADDWYSKGIQFTWWLDTSGYARHNSDHMNATFHDYILNLKPDIKNGYVCDHINRDKLDNRKCNLRIVNATINGLNRSLAKNNTSGYTGIFIRDNGKYGARLGDKYIGTFNTLLEARYARLMEERKYNVNPNKMQMYKLIEK